MQEVSRRVKEIKFTVPGEPKGKARPRFVKTGDYARTYTPDETVRYENLVKLFYQQEAKGTKLNGEIAAKIIGVFSIPKSVSKKNREMMLRGKILHTKKIDCDNLAKIILDSLNGIAYDDDKQVCRLYVEKIYGEQPRVEVFLKEVKYEESSR